MLFAATAINFLLADWSIWWRASGFIVFMTIAIVYSKSLLPRRKLIPPAVIPVAPGDQPTPSAFLARVAEDIGAPAPRRLWIGSGTELALGGRRSLLDLIRIGRWEIQIGLWLCTR
jgi:hypothetical protein